MKRAGNANDQKGDTFIYFPTFRPQLRAIKNKDAEMRMRYAIEDYGIDGTLPDFSDIDQLGVMDGMFEQFRYVIDSAKANREKRSETNSRNGKLGGRPSKSSTKPTESEKKQIKPTESEKKQIKPTESEKSLNVNVNKNVNASQPNLNKLNCVCDTANTLTQNQKNMTPEDEKSYRGFNNIFAEKAPSFHERTGNVSIAHINHLKEHAHWQDIVEAMEEIEEKFVGGHTEYSNAVITIRKFLQAKGKWK